MANARKTKAEKELDERISKAYRAKCCGIQINMMDIGKVFNVGRESARAGATDEQIAQKIYDFVQTIRCN